MFFRDFHGNVESKKRNPQENPDCSYRLCFIRCSVSDFTDFVGLLQKKLHEHP